MLKKVQKNKMHFYALMTIVLFLRFFLLTANAADKEIKIAADIWCPINCQPGSEEEGIGIDLAKKIFEPLGYRISYVVIPWSRALDDVRQGSIDAVIGANANDDPSLIFPKHSVTFINDTFYTKKGSGFVFSNLKSLKQRRLGIIHGYGYSKELQDFIKLQANIPGAVQEVAGDTALVQNIQKLQAGRIDVLVESRAVMNYTLKKVNIRDQIQEIGSIPQGNVYLAFSPKLKKSSALANQYDSGIEELEKEGKLPGLYQRYGLQPTTQK